MKVLFHINHPAQYHLFKQVINDLKKNGLTVLIIARNKDMLTQLLNNDGVEYVNTTHRTDRESNIFSLLINFSLQYSRVKQQVKNFKPDLMIGTSFILPWISKKMKIPHLNFLEDDFHVAPLYSRLSLPLSTYILCPEICQIGKWSSKKIGYNGYHELAFLHPSIFSPSKQIAEKYINLETKNFLLRLTAFNAHHDYGKYGINNNEAKKIISFLMNHGDVYISSERALDSELERLRLTINPNDIHHVMAHCHIIIGDSQSMAMEAACLGIPSIRLNDYAGRISVLEELEKKYQLTHGYSLKEKSQFIYQVKNIAEDPNASRKYQQRKEQMLNDKINVGKFLYWLINNYPESAVQAKDLNLMKEKFGGTTPIPQNFRLKRGQNQKLIIFFSLYFLILFFIYIIPLEGGLKLNRYELSGFRLDHITHFLIFCPLVFVVSPIFLRQTQFRTLKIIALSFSTAALFELIHLIVPYRAFTIEDLIANLIGTSLGAIIFLMYRKKTK